MARGQFIDTAASPENILNLWKAINGLRTDLATAQSTITQQAATIAAQQIQLRDARSLAQQAAVTAGKLTNAFSQSNSGGGSGGDCASKAAMHDSQQAMVEAAKADLLTEGENLSGLEGSWKITNRTVQYLRPSQPTVGLISKESGTNWNGYSADKLMYNDGVVFDLLADAENAPPTGANTTWSFSGCVDPSLLRDPV